MQLGLGSYTYRWSIGIADRRPDRPMDAFTLLDRARDLGLGVVQYADNMPLDQLDERAQYRLFDAAQEAGIALELGTQSFDAAQVDDYLKIAERLEARILRVALDEADAHISVPDLAEQLRPRIERARDKGIKIAIENHFNYPSPRMVELLETVDDPHLGVCLDVANSICAGEWPQETIALLAPYTINLHLKDYEITPDPYGVGFRIHGVPLGTGRAPIPWILDQLVHCPPDMSVLLEHWLMPEGDDIAGAIAREQPWIETSVANARKYLGKV